MKSRAEGTFRSFWRNDAEWASARGFSSFIFPKIDYKCIGSLIIQRRSNQGKVEPTHRRRKLNAFLSPLFWFYYFINYYEFVLIFNHVSAIISSRNTTYCKTDYYLKSAACGSVLDRPDLHQYSLSVTRANVCSHSPDPVLHWCVICRDTHADIK